MTIYTKEQKFSHLKKWVTSRQLLKDYCNEAGVSRSAMSLWAVSILGPDYTSTLRNAEQKALLLKKIEKLETSSSMRGFEEASSTTLVKVSKSKDVKIPAAQISIEYMGAKISIDEKSIEPVFRALKAVND